MYFTLRNAAPAATLRTLPEDALWGCSSRTRFGVLSCARCSVLNIDCLTAWVACLVACGLCSLPFVIVCTLSCVIYSLGRMIEHCSFIVSISDFLPSLKIQKCCMNFIFFSTYSNQQILANNVLSNVLKIKKIG